jgi:hypothetical protein
MPNTECEKIVLLALGRKIDLLFGKIGCLACLRMRLGILVGLGPCGGAGGAGGAGRGSRGKRARPGARVVPPWPGLGRDGVVWPKTHTRTHEDAAPHVPRTSPSRAGVRRWKRCDVRGTRLRPLQKPKKKKLQQTTTPPPKSLQCPGGPPCLQRTPRPAAGTSIEAPVGGASEAGAPAPAQATGVYRQGQISASQWGPAAS